MESISHEDRHFMNHPEVVAYLHDLFPIIIAESDRGAVLLGASQIDEQLKLLFDSLVPLSTNRKRKKEIFNFTGPFGSFAAKLDIAYVCRLLPVSLINAIHRFRKLRNDVAHQTSSFSLMAYEVDVRSIFALVGSGIDDGVSRMAVELMMNSMLSKLTTIEHPIDEGKPLFENKEAVLDYLDQNRHLLDDIGINQLRWEIGCGIALICGLIIHHRERLVEALGERETFVVTHSNSATVSSAQ